MPRFEIHGQDLKSLRAFREVVRCGGFSQAQIRLNISQSSLSLAISQLETRLGMRLCNRGNAGFSLTAEGQVVFEEAEKLFSTMSSFVTRVNETSGELASALSLGLLENSVTHPDRTVVEALTELYGAENEVEVTIFVGEALELESRVVDGRLDCAIGLFPREVESLTYAPLFDERHYLYCGAGHPLFGADAVGIEDLSRHGFVGRDYVDNIDGLLPPEGLTPSAVAPHMEGLVYFILSGRHYGYLPDHVARPWVERGEMKRIDIAGTERVARFQLIHQRTRRKSKALTRFLELLAVPVEESARA